MEIAVDKIKDYLVALKNAGNFTLEDIASVSGVPLSTVRNIYSGKTPDARFGTIAKIVFSLGGDLNELVGYERKGEIEINSTITLKETYEMRITDMIKAHEDRVADIKALCELRVEDTRKCCEMRITDMKLAYEERIAELKNQK